MKPRFTRTTKLWVGLLLAALLLASCSPSSPPLPAGSPSPPPLPAGQIKGKLVANGEPLAGTLYIAIAPSEGAESAWVKLHDTIADEAGNFLYEDMTPGKYLLMVAEEGGALGASFNYVMKDGERYTFELPEGSGVDLGEVDATITQASQ